METGNQQQESLTKQKNPLRIEQGNRLAEYNLRKKEELKRLNEIFLRCIKTFLFIKIYIALNRKEYNSFISETVHVSIPIKAKSSALYIYIFDKNFNNRYFVTLEITLIHTVDIEDNKYYINNIMEKVIPKSETKLLQNFF